MYQDFASNYDRFNNWDSRLAFEMPFIFNQLNALKTQPEGPISVLDSACGTGMHAIHLAQSGFNVSGADLFVGMIEKAQSNAHNAGVKVDFHAAGFGSLAQEFNEQKFNAVLCLGNSLPHLLSQDNVLNALNDFRECLLPGGMLIIQNRNFDKVMQDHNRWMDPQVYQEDDHEWLFQRFYDFELNGLIRFNIVTLQRQTNKDWQASIASTMLQPLLSTELIAQLSTSGFISIRTYADMTGNTPFDADQSSNLVITAQTSF